MFTVKARIYFTSAMTALLVAAGSAYDIFTNSTLLEEVQTAESMHHSALLARILDLDAQAHETWAFENAVWDDMVRFVQGGCTDTVWGNVEVQGAYGHGGLHGVFLESADGTRCFVASSGLNDLDWQAVTQVKSDGRSYLVHGDKLLQVFTVGIRPSADRAQRGPALGRLVSVRVLEWSLAGLQTTLGGTLQILPIGPLPMPDPGAYTSSAPLPGPDGEPVAMLVNERPTPAIAGAWEREIRHEWMVLLSGIAMAFGLVALQRRWLFAPFDRLIRGDPAELERIQPQRDEFGALARIQLRYYQYQAEQKEMIAQLRAEGERFRRLSYETATLTEERNRAMRAAAQQDALDRMLGRLPAAILLLDTAGRVAYANASCRALFHDAPGFPPHLPSTIGVDLHEVAAVASRTGSQTDIRLSVGDELVWVEASAEPISIHERPHLLVTLTAIGERKRSEEALREALALSERALSAKDSFLANTSHELRTPMNAVVGFTYLLDATALDPQQRDWVAKIGSSAQHLLHLLDDLLDHAKLLAGKLELDRSPFDLAEVIESTQALFADRAATKGVRFRVSLPSVLRRSFVGDGRRLKQILINLCSNAIKFTERGSVDLVVSCGTAIDSRYTVIFEVRDTGLGIAAVDLERIFEPFTQADGSSKRRFGGTGLGLSISDTLAKRMGGRLTVTSRVGVGSTFRCLVVLEEAVRPAASEAAARHVGPTPLRGTVLVVDDNALNREILGALIAAYGIEVAYAQDGQDAVDLVASTPGAPPFELVFMDIQMPVLDGIDATRAIRTLANPSAAHQPIVAMSANAMENDRIRSLAAGMDGHLCKPVDRDQLDAVLRAWCGSAGADAEAAPG